MGWIVDSISDGDHEGYVANVLADGRLGGGSSAAGVLIQDPTAADVDAGWARPSCAGSDQLDVFAPWDQVVAWRCTCSCGWTGPSRPAFASDAGDRDCPENLEEEVFRPAWRTHMAPLVALEELADLSSQLRLVESQIATNVGLARAGGVSWSRVGEAVGLSKQGAQQRWG